MATEVTLRLPDRVYNQAAWLAQLMHQDVAAVLTETIENTFAPLGSPLPASHRCRSFLTARGSPWLHCAWFARAVRRVSQEQIPVAVQRRIRVAAGNRCGYCLSPQRLLPWELEIEHIIPSARGGTNAEENLWLSCRACNSFKGMAMHGRDPVTNRSVRLFNPHRQQWSRHFTWSPDGTQIIGLTASGLR